VIDFLLQVGWETWSIFKEASLFLLFGFAVAGVLAVLVPSRVFMRFLGTGRVKSVLWASIIGVPVPLCSCGVLPTALGLVRQGASKGATVAFLIATPETGVDSIAMSWALMDPLITAARPLVAIVTAIVAGLATNLGAPAREGPEPEAGLPGPAEPHGRPPVDEQAPLRAWLARGRQIATYAFRDLFDETAHWLALGVGLSALVAVLLPSAVIERYLGGGLGTMLLSWNWLAPS